MKKYIVCGNYGASNIGDEAILSGVLTDIETISPGSHITVMSGRPEETRDAYEGKYDLKLDSVHFIPSGPRSFIKFFIRKQYKETWKALKQADIFILGGGGLFTDERTVKAPIIWFNQALAAKFFKNDIVIYANSVGPLNGKLAKFLTKKVFSWASKITVRDRESAEILKNIGIDKEIFVTTDPAFNVKNLLEKKSRKKELLKQIRGENEDEESSKVESKKYAVVSLRHLDRTNKLYEKAVMCFIKSLISQNGYYIYLKPFGAGRISDEEYMNKLIDQNDLGKNSIQVHKNDSLEETLDLIKGADFLLGMRLHSLIFSSILCTPFLGLNYSDKVGNFAKTMSLEDFTLDLDKVTYDKLMEKYQELQKYKKQIKEHLESEVIEKKKLLLKNREVLR